MVRPPPERQFRLRPIRKCWPIDAPHATHVIVETLGSWMPVVYWPVVWIGPDPDSDHVLRAVVCGSTFIARGGSA